MQLLLWSIEQTLQKHVSILVNSASILSQPFIWIADWLYQFADEMFYDYITYNIIYMHFTLLILRFIYIYVHFYVFIYYYYYRALGALYISFY